MSDYESKFFLLICVFLIFLFLMFSLFVFVIFCFIQKEMNQHYSYQNFTQNFKNSTIYLIEPYLGHDIGQLIVQICYGEICLQDIITTLNLMSNRDIIMGLIKKIKHSYIIAWDVRYYQPNLVTHAYYTIYTKLYTIEDYRFYLERRSKKKYVLPQWTKMIHYGNVRFDKNLCFYSQTPRTVYVIKQRFTQDLMNHINKTY